LIYCKNPIPPINPTTIILIKLPTPTASSLIPVASFGSRIAEIHGERTITKTANSYLFKQKYTIIDTTINIIPADNDSDK